MKRARVAGVTLFAVVLALAAFVRLDRLGAPSYWLDEILGDGLTTSAASAPWWRWLTGLEHEHGPLYYGTQLLTRLAGSDEGTGRLAAALFGIVTLPLVYRAAHKAGARFPAAGIAAAAVLATSPLHVYYSREARPYSLLMFLTAALLVAILELRTLGIALALLVALLYTTAVAGPVMLAAAVVLLGAGWLTNDPVGRRRHWIAGAGALMAAAFVPLLYGGISRGSASAPASAELNGDLLRTLGRSFTVSAFGTGGRGMTAIALLLFAASGLLAIARRDRRAAWIVAGIALLPVGFALLSLTTIGHWFAPRYAAPGLIAFVVLAGVGISAVAQGVTAMLRRRRPEGSEILAGSLAVVIGGLLCADTWGAARTEAFRKLDWRSIAATLEQHVRSGDVIIAAEPWSEVCLRYYMRSLPNGVRLIGVDSVTVAQILNQSCPATWMVTAGFSDHTAVREWMCGFPLLVASPLEELRVHYAPSARHFLHERSSVAELRAVAAELGMRGFALHMGRDAEILLGSGWADAEGERGDEFRWATGAEASLLVPRLGRRDRIVGIRAMPFSHRTLPPQRIRVAVNGNLIGEVVMKDGWRDYTFPAPAALWHDGADTLNLSFLRTGSPSTLDPTTTDRRPLAAAFARLSVVDADFDLGHLPWLAHPLDVRLASAELVATRTPGRSRHTRFPPGELDREVVEGLLGRVGFDPSTVWPRVARDEVRLEDIAGAVAFESSCEDDRSFLDRAFLTIVERQPNGYEERDLLARLRAHDSRLNIVNRILRAGHYSAAKR
ncbi:MAG: glycosyltransferase family 39 protein [Acidobacteriota bacterium]